jgi:hypothetical protein
VLLHQYFVLLVFELFLECREISHVFLLELFILSFETGLKVAVIVCDLVFEENDVRFELHYDLLFVDHDLSDFGLKMGHKPFFGLELALKLLVGSLKLLVLDLNLVEKLLNSHEVVHVVLKLGLLKLRKGLLGYNELSLKSLISCLQGSQGVIMDTLGMARA